MDHPCVDFKYHQYWHRDLKNDSSSRMIINTGLESELETRIENSESVDSGLVKLILFDQINGDWTKVTQPINVLSHRQYIGL